MNPQTDNSLTQKPKNPDFIAGNSDFQESHFQNVPTPEWYAENDQGYHEYLYNKHEHRKHFSCTPQALIITLLIVCGVLVILARSLWLYMWTGDVKTFNPCQSLPEITHSGLQNFSVPSPLTETAKNERVGFLPGYHVTGCNYESPTSIIGIAKVQVDNGDFDIERLKQIWLRTGDTADKSMIDVSHAPTNELMFQVTDIAVDRNAGFLVVSQEGGKTVACQLVLIPGVILSYNSKLNLPEHSYDMAGWHGEEIDCQALKIIAQEII